MRDVGENVGLYAINQGTLAIDDGNGGLNYDLSFEGDDFSITPKDLTVDFTVYPKTYDGTVTAEISSCNLTGVINLDDVGCDSDPATAEFEDRHVGEDKLVTATGFELNGSASGNYQIAMINTAGGTISPAALSVNAVTDSKTYDGTTSSDETPTVSGLMSGDSVDDRAQAFESKNVLGTGGSTLEVTAYTVNDGNGGDNYSVTTNTATGTISPAELSVNAVTDSKTYDGTTSSDETPTVSGLMSGDSVDDRAQAFESKNVLGTGGSTLEVTAYTVNDGNGGDNYSVSTNTATGTISPAELSVNAVTDSKTYDGTTSSDETPTVSGLMSGDSVDDRAQAFESKNVLGTGGSTLEVTAYTVNDGNGGDNYSVSTNTATGTISPAELSVNAVTDSKTYDGTTSSDETPTVSGLMSGDSVDDRAQAFESKNVLGTGGSTLEVTAYTVNDGNGGDNYSVSTNTATGTISPAELSVNAVTTARPMTAPPAPTRRRPSAA